MDNIKELAEFLRNPTNENFQKAKIKRFKVTASVDFGIYKKGEVIKIIKDISLEEAKKYEFTHQAYLPNQINIEEIK